MGFKHRAKQVLRAVMVLASVGLSLLILRRLGFGQNAGIRQAGLLPMLDTLGFLPVLLCTSFTLDCEWSIRTRLAPLGSGGK
jgi:hypothetical protein